MEKMVKISVEDFNRMNIIKSTIDIDLLEQIISSIKDINEGQVVRVK
jgi:hypothetical protein